MNKDQLRMFAKIVSDHTPKDGTPIDTSDPMFYYKILANALRGVAKGLAAVFPNLSVEEVIHAMAQASMSEESFEKLKELERLSKQFLAPMGKNVEEEEKSIQVMYNEDDTNNKDKKV